MSTPTSPAPGVDVFPCQQCGAQLSWDATHRAMLCPYCGFQQQVAPRASAVAVREIPIAEGYASAARGLGVPVTTIQCKECGATVNVGEGERTATCAFCASGAVLQIQTDANAIRPESLLPFQVDRPAANARFGGWLGKLWFRPNDLKRIAKVQEMGGVYVPFWTFDAQVDSQWTAQAGYHYYESETYTTIENGEEVTRTREVQRTRWEPAWGSRSDFYDDTLVCASKGLPRDLADGLATFDTHQLVAYAPHYLAGWRAETYAVDLPKAHQVAHEKMSAEQEQRCARDVPGDTHRALVVTDHFSRETFKHVLFPVWIAAYRYNDKVFRFLVNGQTGEVVGKAPYSFWKIFLFTLVCVAVVGVVAYLIYQNDAEKRRSHDDGIEERAPSRPKGRRRRPSNDEGSSLDRPDGGRFHRRDGAVVVVPGEAHGSILTPGVPVKA